MIYSAFLFFLEGFWNVCFIPPPRDSNLVITGLWWDQAASNYGTRERVAETVNLSNPEH